MSVGIVAWLGSRTTTDVSGFPGAAAVTTTLVAGVDPNQVGSVDQLSIPGISLRKATIRITQPSGLADGALVRITGTRFPAGALEVTSCLTHGIRTADGQAVCDLSTTLPMPTHGIGALTADYRVHRIITVLGGDYDCAKVAGGCSLMVHPPDGFDDGPTAGLAFATGLPPTSAEAPPTS